MSKKYYKNDTNITTNGAMFYLGNTITFNLDERSYACDCFDIDLVFKNQSQVENVFGKSIDLVSPFDLMELVDATKNTEYCEKYKPGIEDDELSVGSFDFSLSNFSKVDFDNLLRAI